MNEKTTLPAIIVNDHRTSHRKAINTVQLGRIQEASVNQKAVVTHTPLMENLNLSRRFGARIWLKREDLQVVRSYKIRGAYNKISNLSSEERARGIVCASAGNHAQGVAYSCAKLGIPGCIFMPCPTPKQKIRQVEFFADGKVEIIIKGDSFDDANQHAIDYCESTGGVFVPPFDDPMIIEGQATVALEILADAQAPIDVLTVPIGGGGLAAGVGSYFKQLSPYTRIIGVEPAGAPAMKESLDRGEVVCLETIDKFVDGAAVKQVGELTFSICREVLDDLRLVPEGKICTEILTLYNQDAIVVEPAGVLSVAVLDDIKEEIKGKNVVCVLSGSNNDITRTEEIKERSLLYEGLKHYFIVRFPQRAGALREFLAKVLGPTDDIAYFEYSKKNSREMGPAVIGIELQSRDDFEPLLAKLEEHSIPYVYLNDKPDLFHFLV